MSSLGIRLEATLRQERTRCLRGLLANPLITAESELFPLIVRHRTWLSEWFIENPGWKLVVDAQAGFARLHRVPAVVRGTHAADVDGKRFERRRYVLLCLALAALDRGQRRQTTLARLALDVDELSRDTPGCQRFDATLFAERRAFVDVLRWLVDKSVLRLRDGDAARYARSRDGDALYDVSERLLGQLVSSPVPPSLARGPLHLLGEHYPATDEGERLRSRHHALRLVCDEPVVYLGELPPRAAEWLEHGRGFIYRLIEEDLGMQIERRREGLAAVDAAGEVTDTRFPDAGSTVKHAALLLAEQLVERRRASVDTPVPMTWVVERMGLLAATYGSGWSKQFSGPDGVRHLAGEAIALLDAFRLVSLSSEGVTALPAMARFAAAAPPIGV